jgi:hypothetical protein
MLALKRDPRAMNIGLGKGGLYEISQIRDYRFKGMSVLLRYNRWVNVWPRWALALHLVCRWKKCATKIRT